MLEYSSRTDMISIPMVNSITEAIESAFFCPHVPSKDELVRFDGFDALEKEWTLKSFLGLKRDELAERILHGPMGTMSYIESLQVMEPYGFQYYFPAYLLYAVRAKDLEKDDTAQFTFFFLGEALRIRGNTLMTLEQIQVVQSACRWILEKLTGMRSDDESGNRQSMMEKIENVLQKLKL